MKDKIAIIGLGPNPLLTEKVREQLRLSALAPSESAGPSGSLRCDGVVGATLEQRKEWHPASPTREQATRRLKTLIYRLRSRGDEYNADIAEMEILPWVSGPNNKVTNAPTSAQLILR